MSTYQSSSSYRPTSSQMMQSTSNPKNLEGEIYDLVGESMAALRWSEPEGGQSILVRGGSDISVLSNFKGALLKLKDEFFSGSEKIVIDGEQRQQLDRRMILLEQQIEGLLKRRINFSVKDQEGGSRTMDYTGILNEKENQIVELEKKIQNLEERLRRASKRETELEDEIVRLNAAFRKVQNPNISKADIESLLVGSAQIRAVEDKYNKLRSQLAAFSGLVNNQFQKLKPQGIRFEYESNLKALLRDQNLEAQVVDGVLNFTDYREKVVQVPIQDARTKHLIHMLATQMKKTFDKYPKLREECDSRLTEFFQQEIIDIIETDELERVIEIVKYVPDVVKVENVYAYSSEKSKRIEFHLRVLIKALLEELEKLKRKTGLALEMDEGVIGMINQQIMGVVDVDDILKIFRVVPKIVEVEKIVEKVVERVVEIPQVVPIEKIVQKVIEVIKVQEIERIVHVPVELIKYVDKIVEKIVEVEKVVERIVEVPRIMEKVVERIVEIPKVIEVPVYIEKIVEVQKPVIVEKIINHTVPEIQQVQVIKEKIVQVERIIEKIIEVPYIVQKVVQKIVQVPQIVEVEKIVERIIKTVEYRNAREVVNHVEYVPEIIEVKIQKPVPVIQVIEKIVEVPKTVQKIVQVQIEVPKIQIVELISEKIVYQDRIKEVEKIVNHTTTLIKEVEKIVDRRVEVPIIQERIVRVPQLITQVVVERVEVPKIIQVEKLVDKIIEVNKIIEVEKPVNHYITQSTPVKIVVEKIVEVPRTIERIKQVRVNIDKIIEKMVEVPKVVEVEKIVEKIVVVPRVIEKIVEVPQIVEKVVDRIVQIQKIREVQKIVQIPIIQERIKEVEVIKNVYNEVDRIVQKVVEKVIPVESIVDRIQVIKEESEKIVEVKVEVPRELQVERIVTKIVEVEKVVQVDKPFAVPIEVPVPVDRIVEKLVPVEREIEKIVQVTQEIEKIVQVRLQQIKIQEVVQVVEKPIVREVIKEVERIVPYMNETIKEVEVIREKVVPINSTVQQIVEVPNVVEKIVTVTNEIPRVYEVERLNEKIITVPQIVQLPVNTPVIVKVNQVVEALKERVVQIPIIQQQILQVPVMEQKIVAIEKNATEIKQVLVHKDKIVQKDNFILKTDVRNQIETQIQLVDRYEQRIVPVYSTIEKIVEVPHILEKIVQKIVIMPQVVEVLKYVHEIVEQQSLGVAVGIDVSVQQAKYKELYGQIRIHFETVLAELRKLKINNPALKIQIDIIEAFLVELEKMMQFQRIVQVDKEKIVEKQVNVPVLVPTRDSVSVKNELSMTILVEKLIGELKRIKTQDPKVQLNLDEDIQLIFFTELFGGKVDMREEISSQLKSYKETAYNKLYSLGKSWSTDHEIMFNTILQERFAMANMVKHANLEIEKSKSIADQRLQGYKILKQATDVFQAKVDTFEKELNVLIGNYKGDSRIESELRGLLRGVGDIRNVIKEDVRKIYIEEPVALLGEIHGSDGNFLRLQSAFRELERENQVLKESYIKLQTTQPSLTIAEDKQRIISSLRSQIVSLTNEISTLRSKSQVSVNVQGNIQQYEIKIRTLNSKIQELESQLRTQKVDYEGQLRTKNTLIRELEQKVSGLKNGTAATTSMLKPDDSRITGTPYGGTSSSSNIDRMTSSVASSSSSLSGAGLTSSQYGSTTQSGIRYTSGSSYQPPQYGTSGIGSSTYGVGSSSSGLSGSRTGISGTTYGSSAGQTYGATSGQTYGASFGQPTTSTYGTSGATGQTVTYGSGQNTSYGSGSLSGSGVIGQTTTYGSGSGSGVTGQTTTYGSGSGLGSGLAGQTVSYGSGSGSGSGVTGQTTTYGSGSGLTGQTTTYGSGSMTGSGYKTTTTTGDQSGVTGYQSYFSKYAKGGN